MAALITCKNEDDPIKNKGATVVTILFIDFSDAQGKGSYLRGRSRNLAEIQTRPIF